MRSRAETEKAWTGSVKYDVVDNRLHLQREPHEKQPLLARLARVEGQVRGLRQMIESDRYCGEELQQAAAIKAALREVALLCLRDHLMAGIEFAVDARKSGKDVEAADVAVDEILTLLRSLMKQ